MRSPPLGNTIAVHSAVPLPGRDVVVINSEALREECDFIPDDPKERRARAESASNQSQVLERGLVARCG